MPIILIFLTCGAYHTGCTETGAAYYKSEPGLEVMIDNAKKLVENNLSREEVAAISTITEAATKNEMDVLLIPNVSLRKTFKDDKIELLYSYRF